MTQNPCESRGAQSTAAANPQVWREFGSVLHLVTWPEDQNFSRRAITPGKICWGLMTSLKTTAEDTNAFTCCSQTRPPYFQCSFHWCAYENMQVCWELPPDHLWGPCTDKSSTLTLWQGCSFLQWPWRKPAQWVNGLWIMWSLCSCHH